MTFAAFYQGEDGVVEILKVSLLSSCSGQYRGNNPPPPHLLISPPNPLNSYQCQVTAALPRTKFVVKLSLIAICLIV